MLATEHSIRLTATECERLAWVTSIEPENIRNLGDFQRYIDQCKRHFWGDGPETRLLHRLIDEEAQRCFVF